MVSDGCFSHSVSVRLAVGSGNASGILRRVCEQRSSARPLASHLRYRSGADADIVIQIPGKTGSGVLFHDPLVRLSGIYDLSGDGDCYGRYEMVGLQRIFSQSERQDLR